MSEAAVSRLSTRRHSADEINESPIGHKGSLRASIRNSVRRVDPAVMADIKESLVEYSRIITTPMGMGSRIYSLPRDVYEWGVSQDAPRVSWADLFCKCHPYLCIQRPFSFL